MQDQNQNQATLYVFAVVRDRDNALGAITHLVCKGCDEEGFFGLQLIDIEDIRHIDDDVDPIKIELCYLDLFADIPYENIVGTGELLCRTQLEIAREHQQAVSTDKISDWKQSLHDNILPEELPLANIEFLPTYPKFVIEAMIDELADDSDESSLPGSIDDDDGE